MTTNHLIEGDWVEAEAADAVARACAAARDAAIAYGARSRADRARFLNAVADAIEKRADAITEIGARETNLPSARLISERGRTTGQLRYFAGLIERGEHLDLRHDEALPERQPLPRPELKMAQRPLGPVAVFGASNFPLAFSTAGGDTASALAAGCPVIVKGHPAHPQTGALVASAIAEAQAECGVEPGVFAYLQGDGVELGQALVDHPAIRAVGFTGSHRGGKALFDRCAARPEPIPFFGELGSINPVFLMPAALEARGAAIASAWAASLTMGAGQFCTNPGVLVGVAGAALDAFAAAAKEALEAAPAQEMLTSGIASAYGAGVDRLQATEGARVVVGVEDHRGLATPSMIAVAAERFMEEPSLAEEVFGPSAVLVEAADDAELEAVAASFEGQLTATLQMDDDDLALAQRLVPILERKAGRVLANGFPTGVEVADAMVHGGPYPASTNFGATSVGGLAIRRWLRPVCYQNLPDALLPGDLRG